MSPQPALEAQSRTIKRPLVALAALLIPLSAHAAPDDLAVELDLANDMRVAPEGASALAPANDPQGGGGPGHVIYLNYDGGTISAGGNFESNSQNNTSWVCQSTFTPFGAGALQDASIQATRADWEAYNVTLVTSRPASGNYTMNMIGAASCGPLNSGVAPVDCNNENPNDIVFTFANSSGVGADGVATINSQEIAHSFGLMHVNQPADIMNPSGNGSPVSFLDECFDVVGSANCGEQHAAECGSQVQQNSHQELLTMFGPSMPDTNAPTVSITSPMDGQEFAAPATFDVLAEAADDQLVAEVRIFIDGESQNTPDTEAPFSWPVGGVPEGTYTFEVVAVDGVGNETTSAPVTIEVLPEGEIPSGDDGGDDGDDDDGGDGGEDGGEGGEGGEGGGEGGEGGSDGWEPEFDDAGALPPGFGADGDDANGCACRHQDGPTGPMAGLGMLVLLGLVRRRQR